MDWVKYFFGVDSSSEELRSLDKKDEDVDLSSHKGKEMLKSQSNRFDRLSMNSELSRKCDQFYSFLVRKKLTLGADYLNQLSFDSQERNEMLTIGVMNNELVYHTNGRYSVSAHRASLFFAKHDIFFSVTSDYLSIGDFRFRKRTMELVGSKLDVLELTL